MIGLVALLVLVWLVALWDCWQHEPDRGLWLGLLLVFNLALAPVYLVFRAAPRWNILPRGMWAQWTRGHELAQAEAAAHTIGNTHQWYQLGELRRQVGLLDEANEALEHALAKDPTHLPSRWSRALVALEQRQLEIARQHLAYITERDPAYKYGEVYLAYGETLVALNQLEAARDHLETHMRRFARPEARLMLAEVLNRLGDPSAARTQVYGLIGDLRHSVALGQSRHRQLLDQAQRLLRQIGR